MEERSQGWEQRGISDRRRIGAHATVFVVLGLVARSAGAITTPVSGAVSLPGDLDIRLPLSCGESVYVAAGYSESGGSTYHRNTDLPGRANDYYALDFTLPDSPDSGLGQPVLAVAAGTVLGAGWGTSGASPYGQRVVIELDGVGDGHTYVSLYAHLDSIAVEVGEHVIQGQTIGALGDSCDGDHEVLSCPDFGPHLHFALHRDSCGVCGTGTGSSYGGNAVVPEPFDGYEDLTGGMTLESHNCGSTTPPTCDPLPPEGGILDERGPCFERGGTPAYWHSENVGWEDHLLWTIATNDPAPDNWGRWTINLSTAGRYALEAFTDADFAQSRRAEYQVRYAGMSEAFRIDQTGVDGWNPIGTFDFAAGSDQFVLLNDNTGEPTTSYLRLVFDAVRLTRVGGADADADDDVPIDTDADADADADARINADADAAGDSPLTPDDGVETGCGCTLPGGSSGTATQ